mmetsp:Transcript_45368/g.126200  ORF Transcript_45368/g.126200 Transcript_45368/m.126200 type:complete len:444 (+) Transcript_45368:142-1473(+)
MDAPAFGEAARCSHAADLRLDHLRLVQGHPLDLLDYGVQLLLHMLAADEGGGLPELQQASGGGDRLEHHEGAHEARWAPGDDLVEAVRIEPSRGEVVDHRRPSLHVGRRPVPAGEVGDPLHGVPLAVGALGPDEAVVDVPAGNRRLRHGLCDEARGRRRLAALALGLIVELGQDPAAKDLGLLGAGDAEPLGQRWLGHESDHDPRETMTAIGLRSVLVGIEALRLQPVAKAFRAQHEEVLPRAQLLEALLRIGTRLSLHVTLQEAALTLLVLVRHRRAILCLLALLRALGLVLVLDACLTVAGAERRIQAGVVERLALATLAPHRVEEEALQVRLRHLVGPLVGLRLDVADAPADDADLAPQRVEALGVVHRLEGLAGEEARLRKVHLGLGLVRVVLIAVPRRLAIGLDAKVAGKAAVDILGRLQCRKVFAGDHEARRSLLLP